jgi:hypothetical protein
MTNVTGWALAQSCDHGVTLVYDEERGPLYFISQIQDITERKRSEGLVRQ